MSHRRLNTYVLCQRQAVNGNNILIFREVLIEYNEVNVKLACITTIVMALLNDGGMLYCNVEAK